jgi:hypothetical protein
MTDCIPQAAEAFPAKHVASNANHEELITPLAEYHFCWDASVCTSTDGGKRNLRRGTLAVNTPAKSSRIEWNDTRFPGRCGGRRSFRKVAIALDEELASLFPSLGPAETLGVRGIETIDEVEHVF